MIWPVVIAVIMLAISAAVGVNETKVAPPLAAEANATAQMQWLIQYCDAVQLYVEKHGGSGQISNGSLGLSGMAVGNAQYAFKNFVSGAPTKMLQCWISPTPQNLMVGDIAAAAKGSAIVGTAISTSTWDGVMSGVQVPLVHQVPSSDVGTAVVEAGY